MSTRMMLAVKRWFWWRLMRWHWGQWLYWHWGYKTVRGDGKTPPGTYPLTRYCTPEGALKAGQADAEACAALEGELS